MPNVLSFDFDGTIADSVDLILEVFSRIFREEMGDKAPSRQMILDHFGMNELGILRWGMGEKKGSEAIGKYVALLQKLHPHFSSAPFPGILDLLIALKAQGFTVTLLTGRCEATTQISLKYFGIASLFDRVQYGSAEKTSKADQLRQLMALCHCTPDELIYIGDTAGDVLSCREAGVRCLSAAWSPTARVAELEKLNPGNLFLNIASLREKLLGPAENHAKR